MGSKPLCLAGVAGLLFAGASGAIAQDFQVIENVQWLGGISADGRYVTGVGNDAQPGAFRFDTVTGERMLLGIGWPADMTPDGSAIVGSIQRSDGAFLWTESEGYINLSDTVSVFSGSTVATAISDNGQFITGNPSGRGCFLYSRAGRVIDLENCLTPYAISADGSVVAGSLAFPRETEVYATVWTDEGVPTSFRVESEAVALTPDGRYAAGGDGVTRQPYRWSEAGGLEVFDALAGTLDTRVFAISSDGSRLAGYMNSSVTTSFLWDEKLGTRSLMSFLEDDHGFDLEGWSLTLLLEMSDDGRSFAGLARNPMGDAVWYVARVGEPCLADLDGDGELSLFDFIAFQNLFATGDLQADLDGDGALTLFDFLEFQSLFAVGCG